MGVTRVDNIPLWQCTECGKLYGSKEQAELCHKEYICEKFISCDNISLALFVKSSENT